jgi:hypothetical protein
LSVPGSVLRESLTGIAYLNEEQMAGEPVAAGPIIPPRRRRVADMSLSQAARRTG